MHTAIKLIVLKTVLIIFSLPDRSKQNKKPLIECFLCQPLCWMLCSRLVLKIVLYCRHYFPTLRMKKLRLHEPRGFLVGRRAGIWISSTSSKSVFLTTMPPLSGSWSTLAWSPFHQCCLSKLHYLASVLFFKFNSCFIQTCVYILSGTEGM